MTTMRCPCQLNPNQTPSHTLLYKDCCEPLHTQQIIAENAEQLMRSRYSAFVLEHVDYVIHTTLPAQQPFLNHTAIAQWAKQTNWQGLEVVAHAKQGKRHAQVEFKAYFSAENTLKIHHELSAFTLINKGAQLNKDAQQTWYFLDPTLTIKIPQKRPCICGSGEKFKRCCGQFI